MPQVIGHFIEHSLCQFCVCVIQIAKYIIAGSAKRQSGVILHDYDGGDLFFNQLTADFGNHVFNRAGSDQSENHDGRDYHCQYTADQFADLVIAQGKLHDNMSSVNDNKNNHRKNGPQIGKHTGCHQLDEQRHTAHKQ